MNDPPADSYGLNGLFEAEAEAVEAKTFNLDAFLNDATEDEIDTYLQKSPPERQELIANKLSKIGRNNKLLNNYNKYKKTWELLHPDEEFNMDISTYQSKPYKKELRYIALD